MSGTTIGKSLNYGFAGSYARQPDMIIETRANVETVNPITFGRPVMQGTNGTTGAVGVVNITGAFTAAAFVGIAAREVKSALSYSNQGLGVGGQYQPNEPVPVFQRGSISVICSAGTPTMGSAVYVRVVAASGKFVGDLEAAADGSNNVLLTNAQWGGPADANRVAELVLLTRSHA